MLLLLIVAVLHTLDRQGEFVSRTDFLWKAKLKVEQEEVETMRGINKVIYYTHKYILYFLSLLEYKFPFDFPIDFVGKYFTSSCGSALFEERTSDTRIVP